MQSEWFCLLTYGICHRSYTIQILDLAARTELSTVSSGYRNVDVDPHGALLHVCIASMDCSKQGLYFANAGGRLHGTVQVWL